MSPRRQTFARWLVALSMLVGFLTSQTPAFSSNPTAAWYFAKTQDNSAGTLTLYNNGNYYAYWRAGSGNTTTDECATNAGPLPDGTYGILGYSWNWPGTTVRGPVLELPNMRCYNGTLRTALFVHSTYPWSSSHYYSLGCIKLSNTGGPSPASGDIQNAVQDHVNVGQATYLYVYWP